MIPDSYKRTVKIPVRVKGGKFVPLDGSSLPKFSEGTIVDLVLPFSGIADKARAAELRQDQVVPALPAGSVIYLGISPGMAEDEKIKELIKPEPISAAVGYRLVEVILKAELKLRLRKNKDATFEACRCEIPILKKDVWSLNQAFMQVSTAFETRRLSHTGNVFERGFTHEGEFYFPLADLRWRIESEFANQEK